MLVPRSTFIYHYFASLPFIMILTVYIFRQAHAFISGLGSNRALSRKLATGAIVAFFVFALALACLFYPVWSGVEVSKEYVSDWLWWIPSFRSGDGLGQGWHFYN